MKTIILTTAATLSIGSASLAAHARPSLHGSEAMRNFQALVPARPQPKPIEGPVYLGTGDDSKDSLTGGPVGGLIDRN